MSQVSIADRLTYVFKLTPDEILACQNYYVLYWQSSHIVALASQFGGKLVRQKVKYSIIFQDGLTLDTLKMSPDSQVILSFRRLKGSQTGYVIIRRPTDGDSK